MSSGNDAENIFNVVDLDAVYAALKGIEKKAARIGVAAPSIKVHGSHVEYEVADLTRDEHPRYWGTQANPTQRGVKATGRTRVVHHVELVVSEPVILAGWKLVAAIDHLDDDQAVVSSFGGDCPVEYRTRGPVCDHCRHNRKRKQTLVVKHEDGRYAQIGRQCAKDFLGHDLAKELCLLRCQEELRVALEASADGSANGRTEIGLENLLAWTAKAIREGGWVSRKTKEERGYTYSTSDVVEQLIVDYRKQALGG